MRRLTVLAAVLASAGILLAGAADTGSDRAKPPVGPVCRSPDSPGDGGTDGIIWNARADAPLPGRHWCPAAGNVRDTIWLLGGRADFGGGIVNSTGEIIAYVPAEDTWLQAGLPALGTPRRAGAGGVIGSRVYACGGRDTLHATLATAEYLDVDSMVVRSVANMPGPLWAGAGAAAGGRLYVIGDENRTGNTFEYDPATNTWRTKAPLPVGRGWTAAAGAGGRVYVFGGSGTSDLADCWEYDPATDSWTQKADMPGTRTYHCAVTFDDALVYVIGGSVDGSRPCDGLVYVYDVGGNSWSTETAMPTPRGWAMAAQSGSRLYVACGSDGATPTYLTANEEAAFAQHDVAVRDITPLGRILPDTLLSFGATLRNCGLNPETFDAGMTVRDSATGDVLIDADTTLELAAGATREVEFGRAAVGLEDVVELTAFVLLPGDEDPGNDTLTGRAEARLGSAPDGFGYIYQSTQEPDTLTFAWWDTAGGTVITDWTPNPDDGYSVQPLPFTFPYYDQDLTSVTVCSNGFLETGTSVSWENGPLPEASIPNLMAGWWDDLDPASGGAVCRHSIELDREWVVFSWVDVPRFNTSELETFQVGLSEDGIVRCNYASMNGALTSSTVGIQGVAGAEEWFHEYACNGAPANHVARDSVSVIFYYPPYIGMSQEREQVPGPRLELPSPFRAHTVIRYTLDAERRTLLQVLDPAGRVVRTLRAANMRRGAYSISWDSRDDAGRQVAPGVYFVRLATGPGSEVAKVVLVK